MKDIVFNHSSSLTPSSTLSESSLAVVEEILAVKWPNPGHKFRELDRIDEEIDRELREAHQEYSKSPNKKNNRVRVLQALQTKIEALNKEYQHAVTQQKIYADKIADQAQKTIAKGWDALWWGLQTVAERIIGSHDLQQEQHYREIAQDRLKKMEYYNKEWRNIYDVFIEEKNGKKLKLMSTQTANCVADFYLSELQQDSVGYSEVNSTLKDSDSSFSLEKIGNNPSVLLPNNQLVLVTFDNLTSGTSNIYYYFFEFEDPRIISNSSTGDKSYPVVAGFDNGQFLVAWHSNSTPSDFDIYAQCFNASFQPLGSAVRINNRTLGRQWYPAISIWQDTFAIVWESDNTNSIIDFNNYTSVNKASQYSAVYGQFFTVSNEGENLICEWTTGPDVPISTSDVGHKTATGVDIVAVEDPKTSTPQFIVSFVGKDNAVYIRPFSLTGEPLRYPVSINSYPPVKVPSGISIENLYNGKIIIVWNEQENEGYYNYCSPSHITSETDCENSYSYYNGVCYYNFSFVPVSDYNIKGQIFSISDSEVMFGFPAIPQTLIATSTAYDETYPVVGTFLGGNFVTVWKAKSKYFNGSSCSSELYARFYDDQGIPLPTLYCIPNVTNSLSNAKDLAISTFSGDFILFWSDYDSDYNVNGKINALIYTNQPPGCNFDKNQCMDMDNITWKNITKQGTQGDTFTINYADYFNHDPEGASITFTINTFLGFKNVTSGDPILSQFLPSNFQFSSNAELTIQFNGSDYSYIFQVSASDPYGQTTQFYSRVSIQNPKTTPWDKAKPILSALGSISGAFLAVWAYMWNQYRLKKYREFQHPFASELHECLNLGYADFSSGPGKEYADVVSLMLQTMRQKTGRDIQILRTAKDADNRLLYHYYVFLFAKEILRLSGSMELLRNTAICGIELKGPFASREILLADFRGEADNIVGDVLTHLERAPQPPEEWQQKFADQEASEAEEKNSTACRDRMRRTCYPFQRSDTFRMFQMKTLMSKGLSSSQHGEIFSETKSPRAISSSSALPVEPQRRRSDLFAEHQTDQIRSPGLPNTENLVEMFGTGSGVDSTTASTLS